MKKFISIMLCLCLILIPINVQAVDLSVEEKTVTDSAILPESDTNVVSELTEHPNEQENIQTDITIEESSEIKETQIDDGGITITHAPGSPEEQAIQKILAHKKSMGEEIPNETKGLTEDLVDGGVYYIKNYFSGKYLNVHYGVDANGTNVYQWTGDSSTEQKFKVVYHSATDSYKIYAMCSSNGNNRVLDVVRNGAPLASGQNVDIWTPVDHTAQRLILTPLIFDNLFHIHMLGNEDLYFTTIDKSNGTSGGTNPTSAGNVFIQTFDINDNQQWQFIRISNSSSPSVSATITGSQPYHTGNYTLSAGRAWYAKFTPTGNYDCSVFTMGSLDTCIDIYADSSCTNPIDSNDQAGHDDNALVYFNATSGATYYIKVTGYTSSVSGSFKFILHRGLPTSQSEKGNMFTTFNSSTYQENTNCYTYALGYYKNPKTGNIFRWNGQNPGEMSSYSMSYNYLDNVALAHSEITAALTSDCNYFDGDWAQISKTAQPRKGYYKVALVLAPGEDYHWYRQLSNGKWVHKLSTRAAVNTDCSGNIIYDPSTCNRDYTNDGGANYSEFVGWYEVKAPTTEAVTTNIVNDFNEKDNNLSSMVGYPYYPVKSPIYKDLTMKEVNELYIGMPYEASLEIMGAAHRYFGDSALRHLYDLNDGTIISIIYTRGAISRIIVQKPNGKRSEIEG